MTDCQFTTEELANEIWKQIPGFEGYYSASSIGRIRRDKAANGTHIGLILKGKLSYDGYLDVTLYKQGKPHYFHVHQLVARTFLGPCPTNHTVNHIRPELGKTCNRASNLEYLTHRGQMDHAMQHGLRATGDRNGSRLHPERLARGSRNGAFTHPEKIRRGSTHGRAKLTDDNVRAIRQLLRDGIAATAVARQFNVSNATVSHIKHRRKWTHVIG